MTTTMASALYVGWLRHRRQAPCDHRFRYRLFMMYLDLAELDRVFAGRWLWSLERSNLACFRRSDYHGDPRISLDEAVRRTVTDHLGRRPDGPIRLLTHLRYFGHCFNPVSFYYGFRKDDGTLDWIMAEISNTPWRERHVEVLAADRADRHGAALHWRFEKTFHVSPFLPIECRYDWRFTPPGTALRSHMQVEAEGHRFDATLVLERRAITRATLAMALLRHPAMTARILLGIHWQALRLWLKGTPVFDHPRHRHACDSRKHRPEANPTTNVHRDFRP